MARIQVQGNEWFDISKRALLLLTYARRPLLSAELQHALGVDATSCEFDNNSVPEIGDLLSACAGLVIHQVETDVVQLVHKSTQDYFSSTGSIWLPNAEEGMQAICLVYIDAASKLKGTASDYPFLDYAEKYWGSHGLAADKEQTSRISEKRLTGLNLLPQEDADTQRRKPTTRLGLTQMAKDLGGMDELLISACENNKQAKYC